MGDNIIQKINEIGTRKVADACGVTDAAVSTWKRKGMPTRKELQKRVTRYKRIINQLHTELFDGKAA